MALTKLTIPDDFAGYEVSSLDDRPDMSADALKQRFDASMEEVMAPAFNALIDDLEATTDGASGADQIGCTAVGNGTAETVQGVLEEIHTNMSGGWIPVTDTWTRASATTITVPAGATSIYKNTYGFRFKQGGGYKYFYCQTVASALLTVNGGSDYTVVEGTDITDIAYTLNPSSAIGFPAAFNYTPTGVSASNVNLSGRFMLQGRRCFVDMKIYFSGAITFTTMPTLPIPASSSYFSINDVLGVSGIGSYYNDGTSYNPNGIYPVIAPSATVVALRSGANGTAMSATSPITWANNDAIEVHFNYEV